MSRYPSKAEVRSWAIDAPAGEQWDHIAEKSCEWLREQLSEMWSEAIQSDLEHGVKVLNEIAAQQFTKSYPKIAEFGLLLDGVSGSAIRATSEKDGE